MKNNDIITQILNGNIGIPQNMSVPSSKGLPNNMSIPNDPRYGFVNPNDELNTFIDKEIKNQDWYDPSNYEEINDDVELNNTEDNNNTDESILNSLNLPQKKEYSFENGFKSGMGIEDILGKYKDIQKGLGYEKKPINTALSERQSNNALLDALAAASQGITNTPRGDGFRGFMKDLGAMLVPGTMAYKASEEKALRENEAKKKAQEVLEMQQEAIARAIEKELYSREYAQEKLGLERERIISDKDFKRQQQEALNNYRNEKLKIDQDKKEEHKIIDGVDFIKMKTPAERTETTKAYKAVGAALDGFQNIQKEYLDFLSENVIGKDEKRNEKNEYKLSESPIKYSTSRAKFTANEFMQKLPFTSSEENTKIIAKWNALKAKTKKYRVTAENALRNGGVLPQRMYEDFEKNKMLPDLDRDNDSEFLEKLNDMIKELTLKRDVAKFSLDNNVLIDSVDYLKMVENNQEKKPKKEAAEGNNNKTTNQNTDKDPFVVEEWSEQ